MTNSREKEKKSLIRFLSKVNITKGCWLWLGNKKSGGYGQFAYKGKQISAHRWSFQNIKGIKIKDGNFVCHSCDNPPCVNPNHLWQGTRMDNIRDSMAKGRWVKKENIPKIIANFKKYRTQVSGEQHGSSKLKETQAIEIIKSKEMTHKLAKKYKVCVSMIRFIRAGKYWNTPACVAARAKISEVGE